MAFKMKGFSGFGNSPMKQVTIKPLVNKKFKKIKNKKTEEDIAREEYEKRTKNLKNISKKASKTAVEGLAEGAAGGFIGKSETLNPKTNKTTELDEPKRQPERRPKRQPVRNKQKSKTIVTGP